MEKNGSLKERLARGEMVFGVWNSVPSPTLVEIIGLSGIDFVVIDAEHGPLNMETAQSLLRAAQAVGMEALVRPSASQAALILRALDIGAVGVQVPHVSTKEEAAQVVQAAKYFPQGCRGFSPFTRAGDYGLGTEGYARRANQESMVVLNIEGKQGVENIDGIAAVPGVDVIFIGPYDLSQSLGRPGDVRTPEVIAAIRHGVSVAAKHGIACGSFACDRAYLQLLIDCGVRYLTYMVDAPLIGQAFTEAYGFFQAAALKQKVYE